MSGPDGAFSDGVFRVVPIVVPCLVRPLRNACVGTGRALEPLDVGGEELAAEVVALRDERPRRSPSNDSAQEYDGAGRAAARPWNKRHGCLLPSFRLQ